MSAVFPWTASSSTVDAGSANYTASGSYTPQFPNVPALPGVPQIGRLQLPGPIAAGASNAYELLSLGQELGTSIAFAFGLTPLYSGLGLRPLQPSYSIIPVTGTSGITPDSAMEVEVHADSGVMSHPIEQGGFEAYNRVQEPIVIRLLLACQGKKMARTDFLSTLESMREGTNLYTVALPDALYKNMVLKGYGYKKSAERGAVTIWADTEWREARSTNVVLSTPVSLQPQGAVPSNLGSLAPQIPAPLSLAAILASPVGPSPLPSSISQEVPPSLSAF